MLEILRLCINKHGGCLLSEGEGKGKDEMIEEAVAEILKKRKPSGKDLGRLAFFIDMFVSCAKQSEGSSLSYEKMQQYLQKHLEKLGQYQTEVYVNFSGLYNIVHTYNHLGQGYYQQALRCFYRIMLIVGNSPIFIGINSMDDEFDVENLKEDISGFVTALKRSFAIDQFFKDIEVKFDLEGIVEVYGVSDTLAECVQSYNDVVERLKEKNLPEYNDLLSYLPHILIDECLPSQENIKTARNRFKSISSFRNKVTSTEFYDAYISEK